MKFHLRTISSKLISGEFELHLPNTSSPVHPILPPQSRYPKYCASCNSPYWDRPKVKFIGQRKKAIPEAELCDDDACDADEDGKQYFGDE
jgi:hypothetical protein